MKSPEGVKQEGVVSIPVVVALDDMREVEAVSTARHLAGMVWGFKVNDLLLRAGGEVVNRLSAYGKVFCDAKLHDIPNTVANQVRVLEEAGADLITVHGSGGEAMLRAAAGAVRGKARILAVTVLTSLEEEECKRLYGRGVSDQVRQLAGMALSAGLGGVVSSAAELPLLAGVDPERKLYRVTPGIRPEWHAAGDDQRRVMTPGEALAAGADLLVIGRPITAASNPIQACRRLAADIRNSR